MHQPRIDAEQRVMAHTITLQRAVAEVFEQHIGGGDEFLEHLGAARIGEIDHHPALAVIHRYERGRHAIHHRRPGAHLVVLRRMFDTDHVRAQIGED